MTNGSHISKTRIPRQSRMFNKQLIEGHEVRINKIEFYLKIPNIQEKFSKNSHTEKNQNDKIKVAS